MPLIITEKTPKEWKDYATQNTIHWDTYASPWGTVMAVETIFGISLLEFVENATMEEASFQEQWLKRWRFAPKHLKRNTSQVLSKVFPAFADRTDDAPLKVLLVGTVFQRSVWRAISTIPKGKAIAYKELAQKINKPRAVRAVGNAVGKNPLSLFIPCHRILRADGTLGGYRWNVKRKEMILAKEGYFIT